MTNKIIDAIKQAHEDYLSLSSLKGGSGSGNHGHQGRPGKQGGSSGGGTAHWFGTASTAATDSERTAHYDKLSKKVGKRVELGRAVGSGNTYTSLSRSRLQQDGDEFSVGGKTFDISDIHSIDGSLILLN